ncbi:TPA: hypothetical protein K8F70_002423 [Listeria monocytogenes]|nr:hypothetical protein [Listeria monocytogenes]
MKPKKMAQPFTKAHLFLRKGITICSSSLFLFFSLSSVAYADANAKDASNYILNDWIAPIFGVIVVYLVIKEFLNSKWIQGFAILFFGGIIYAVIKDPTGVLNSLSNLKSYFGL